jgi:hypothetical protein
MSIDWFIYRVFTYCDGRERNSDENIIFRCSFIGYLFRGVSYGSIRERVSMFDYDTKEKEHQNTRQSDLYSEGLRPLVQIR